MTRTSASFTRMAWLALVATLLTAVMPTVSRIVASAATSATPLLLEMCTAAGIKLVKVPPPGGGAPQPGHPAPSAMGDACGYCVLATSLPVFLLLLGLAVPQPRTAPVPPLYLACLRLPRNTRGLGSQAPPLAL